MNNVGTHLVEDGYAADRGWLERDHGQYERAEDVFAWCGAAVLLRGDYLRDVGTFDERLFLYSEDVELAWRGLGRGWRHRYVPGSVVRHVHAATAQRSTRTATLKERNRLLVLVRHARPGVLARALLRYVLVTASYARRDLLDPAAGRRAAASGRGRPAGSGLRGRSVVGSGDGAFTARRTVGGPGADRLKARATAADTPGGVRGARRAPSRRPRMADHG